MRTIKFKNGATKEFNSLSDADLSSANLSDADLSDADLPYANLSDANLSRADLSSANLSYTNLSDANLSDADLAYANLSHANLSHANLSDANLFGADLYYAKGIIAIHGCRYPIYATTAGVQIGCKWSSIEYWLAYYNKIGRLEDFTNYEIEEYKLKLDLVAAWTKLQKGKNDPTT